MKKSRLLMAAVTTLAVGAVIPGSAQAQQSYNFSFTGSGVSGTLMLSYGAATDSKYPNGFEVTGISGNFSDTNHGLGLDNATVGSLVAINHATPTPDNTPAPHDFSTFLVAAGLPPQANGALTFDNLLWPLGAPVTCIDFPGAGGFLDTYGLMFTVGNDVVDIWSNGVGDNGVADYGLAVANSSTVQDYLQGGVATTTTPEPGTLWLVGTGFVGMLAQRRRSRTS